MKSITCKYYPRAFIAILLFLICHTASAGNKLSLSYLWASNADSPLNVEYSANSNYRSVSGFEWLNSTSYPFRDYFGETALIKRTGIGNYTVTLVDMPVNGGIAHTTAYSSNNHCKIGGWGPSGGNTRVTVKCFTPSGTPANSKFVMLYNSVDNQGYLMNHAYLWAHQSTQSSYTPISYYQHNSGGATNTIRRLGTGMYRARLPNVHNVSFFVEKAGSVMVTAYGYDSNYCKVKSWTFSGNDAYVYVNCYNTNGELEDSLYNLSFFKDAGQIAAGVSEDTQQTAYAWVNDTPVISDYYQHNNSFNTPTTAFKQGTGRYRVQIYGLRAYNDTASFVTAYGNNSNYCNVGGWGARNNGVSVSVNCFNDAGIPIDSQFNLQYFTNETILY